MMAFQRFVAIVAMLSGVKSTTTKLSPTRAYLQCGQVSVGGDGLVVSAVSYEIGGSPANCESGTQLILKCGAPNRFPAYQQEYNRMVGFSSKSWAPRVYELFSSQDAAHQPCIAMEKLGMDLQRIRLGYPSHVVKWSWATVGTIGARMVDVIESLHSDFGLTHTDLHAANWMLANDVGPSRLSPLVKLIDFGDSVPIRSPAYAAEDVRELVLTVRYLFDGDLKYYVWKRYAFNEAEVCAGIPAPLCDALKYVHDLPATESIDYQRVKTYMVQLAEVGGTVYTGEVDWTPVVAKYGLPTAPTPGGAKPKAKVDAPALPVLSKSATTRSTTSGIIILLVTAITMF